MSALLRTAQKGVRQIRDGMERPDQDWLPTLMYLDSKGKCSIVGLALGDGPTPQDISAAAEFVTGRLREAGATEAVFVCGVLYRDEDEPVRKGVMVAHVIQEATELQMARVERTAWHPHWHPHWLRQAPLWLGPPPPTPTEPTIPGVPGSRQGQAI